MYREPSPTLVRLEVQLTAADYIAAQRLNLRPGRPLRIFLYCLLPVVCVGSIGLLYDWIRGGALIKSDLQLPIFIPLMACFVLLWNFALLPWQTRKIFKQQKSLHDKLAYRFDTAGMHVASPHGTLNVPWSHFRKWKANGRVLVLFHSDVTMNFVPLRVLPDAASREALLALVEGGIGPQA